MVKCEACKAQESSGQLDNTEIAIEKAFVVGYVLGRHAISKGPVSMCPRHKRLTDEAVKVYIGNGMHRESR